MYRIFVSHNPKLYLVSQDEDRKRYDEGEDDAEMDRVFKKLRKCFKEKARGLDSEKVKDKIYSKIQKVYTLLSDKSKKIFKRRIMQHSDLSIITKDEYYSISETLSEMINSIVEEYPVTTAYSVKKELDERIKDREICIKLGKSLAKQYGIDN